MSRRGLLALLLALSSFGCASQGLYDWGHYEGDLYKAYRHPEKEAQFEDTLVVLIQRAQKRGTRVPPGIYAEYAYQLYEENQLDATLVYLAKERDAWPESVALMALLIAAVEREQVRREEGGEPDDHLAWAVDPGTDGSDSDASDMDISDEDADGRSTPAQEPSP